MVTPPEKIVAAQEVGPSPAIYKAYGSGAPSGLGLLMYVAFVVLALGALAPQILHPTALRGFGGFLIYMMDKVALMLAFIAAYAAWRWLSWRLRGRYPDKLLVSADDLGIKLPSGQVIPYSDIFQIDPHSQGSRMGTDNWIAIQTRRWRPWRVDVNMSIDPPEDILANLRERALAGGANLLPARLNGRPNRGGSQLGYREGMGWEG